MAAKKHTKPFSDWTGLEHGTLEESIKYACELVGVICPDELSTGQTIVSLISHPETDGGGLIDIHKNRCFVWVSNFESKQTTLIRDNDALARRESAKAHLAAMRQTLDEG